MLPVFHNLNYKRYREDCLMCCPSNKVLKSDNNKLSSSRRVTRRLVMRHFTSNGANQCRNGSSSLLIPYREQPRSTRIVVAYPRLAFSTTKRTNHAPIGLINKPKFVKATRRTKYDKANRSTEVHGSGSLELVKLAREPASSRPKPCVSLKKNHESCPFAAPCWPP